MSVNGERSFRPVVHYTPQRGWINDPNGLVYDGSRYHLFAQHHPHSTVWGPMHWGHAVSDDRITWKHLPVALHPDDTGMIFSGSAVADTENLSGLGKDGQTPLIALYTCHGEQETQALAYSLDGVTFTKYEKNPVIPNPGVSDFRDPKIFRNPVSGGWSMVLAAKDRVFFYSTNDFLHWKKTGEFGPAGNYASGIWECPDLIPLDYDGKTLWMLIVSMTTTTEEGRANTQYFLGAFDGHTFTCTVPFGHMEKIDDGYDNYAGVSFNHTDETVLIGWGLNWEYAGDTPTGAYCGQMTLPRKLSLVRTPNGPRLASAVTGLSPYMAPGKDVDGTLNVETFLLRVEGAGPCTVTLANKDGQRLLCGVDAENKLFVDRTNAGATNFNDSFASSLYSKAAVSRFF